MSQLGEPSIVGQLSLLEVLLLKSIDIQGIETSPETVYHMCSQSYNLASKCTSLQFPLYPHDIKIVKQFLSKLLITITILMKLLN